MRPPFTSTSCPNCSTYYDRVPVEYDEDGSYAVLEVYPCADADCGKLLCPCCEQFHCDGCGQTFCADHLVSIPETTGTPMHCCGSCAAECEPLELSERIPLQSEVVGPSRLEAA